MIRSRRAAIPQHLEDTAQARDRVGLEGRRVSSLRGLELKCYLDTIVFYPLALEKSCIQSRFMANLAPLIYY